MAAIKRNVKASGAGGRRNPIEDGGGGGTTGGTRTTRTGTPRTSTNTSAPSRRTSPGQRTSPSAKTRQVFDQMNSWAIGKTSAPSTRDAKKLLQKLDGQFSQGKSNRIDAKLKKAGSKLSPKQGRKIKNMAAKQARKVM